MVHVALERPGAALYDAIAIEPFGPAALVTHGADPVSQPSVRDAGPLGPEVGVTRIWVTPFSGSTEAPLVLPVRVSGLAAEPEGEILVSDARSGTIWRLGVGTGTVALAVTAARGQQEPATRGPLAPAGLAVSPDGSLWVADPPGHRVWAIAPDGVPRLVVGGASGYRDGPIADAMFRFPRDVAVADDGTCYVADTGNHCIRAIAPDGTVRTVAGSIYDYGDGLGREARFRRPEAIDVSHDGTCYVADTGNHAIRRISPNGEVTTVAGEPPGGDCDGVGRGVGLRWPTGIALGADGSIWVADHGNSAVRRIDAQGSSTTMLRRNDECWPAFVARRGTAVIVAATAASDDHVSQACLVALGRDR